MSRLSQLLTLALALLFVNGCGGDSSSTAPPASDPVAAVVVSPAVDTILVGEGISLQATARTQSGSAASVASIAWTSSNDLVATVSAQGRVAGVSPGTATIRGSLGTVSGVATVVVQRPPVSAVDVSLPGTTLRVGRVAQLVATPRTATGAEVTGCAITWLASDGAVAQVSATGSATAMAAGTTAVTATADCGPAGKAQGVGNLTVDPSRIVAVGTGRRFSCALVEDGRLDARDQGAVYCWGNNIVGQVGDGSNIDRSSPTRVEFPGVFGGSPAQADPSRRASELLVVGDSRACALTPDGAAWCWGDNGYGQLGDGTSIERSRPVLVQGGHHFVALTSGEEFVCGVDTAGLAWCWGQGSDGQLGNGDSLSRSSPVAVAGDHSWTFLRAGQDNVCGITTLGATLCWGDNFTGAVGDGTKGGDRLLPTLVQGPVEGAPSIEFSWLGIGHRFVCGVESGTGATWCWGRNSRGQLGIGMSESSGRPRPVAVVGPNNVFRTVFDSGDDDVETACGIAASAAEFGGPAYCWGANDWGQLGDGTTVDRNVPTALASTESFLLITPGEYHACGLTTRWRLMCWGSDDQGQLGTGLPFASNPTPAFVPFPAGAPLPAVP